MSSACNANKKCLFVSAIPAIGSIVSVGALFFYAARVISSVSDFFALKKQSDTKNMEGGSQSASVANAEVAAADAQTQAAASVKDKPKIKSNLCYMGLHFLNIVTGGISSGVAVLVKLTIEPLFNKNALPNVGGQ